MTPYDDQNVFAKILRGEVPCFEVFRDDHSLAFLDIMPRSPGHTLVVPRAPARGILDIADDDLAAVARTAKRIAIAAMMAMIATTIMISTRVNPFWFSGGVFIILQFTFLVALDMPSYRRSNGGRAGEERVGL